MGRFGYVLRHFFGMDLHCMFEKIRQVQTKSGRSFAWIFADMINCALRYQAGYTDYALFEMYNLNSEQRKTIVTRGINNSFMKRFNNPDYTEEINDKLKFVRNFSEFLHRDWIDISTASAEEFSAFVNKHSEFIAKPVKGMCGKGIQKICASSSCEAKLIECLRERDLLLLEEVVIQHPVLSSLHPDSINTCRVVTLYKNSETRVVVAYLRIGNGRYVDNFNSGGLVVPVEISTGYVRFPAVDKKGGVYENHPLTGVQIKGFRVPMWEDVLNLVKKAGGVIPQVGLVGWDVAISEKGPLLIEGNNYPGHDIYSLPPHRVDGKGVLPEFLKAIGTDSPVDERENKK